MKKIELQLTATQLNTLVYSFGLLEKIYPKTRREKVMKSILVELAIKLQKKHIEVKAFSKTLFSKPKKPKFTFKYYEADALENFLLLAENEPLNEYDRNCVRFLIHKLNQQLA